MKILVVSNMYPDEKNPSYGIFVKRFCEQLEYIGISYDKSVMYKGNGKVQKIIRYIMFYCLTVLKIWLRRYDLVYVHYASHSGVPVLFARKLKQFKIYTNVHGSDVVPENNKQEKFQKYTRRLLEMSGKIIVPSEYFQNYVSNKYFIDKEKIYVYPSAGINSEVFYKYDEFRKQNIRRELGITIDTELVIGFVGRLSYGKGWDTFVQALKELNYSNPNLQFKAVIVGCGSEENALNTLISESELKDKIIRLKLVSQERLADIYNCFSIFVFPTEREGESLGLVALEAMACGIPVISSDFAAPKYYVKNAYNGYRFKVKNFRDLSSHIREYLSLDENDKELLSENAYVTATEYFEQGLFGKLKLILS